MAEMINKALEYSQALLKNHKRLAGDTVHEHSLRVYEILKDNHVRDELTLSAALIHPVLEYSEKTEEIARVFGNELYEILKNYHVLSKASIEKDTPSEFNEAFLMQAYISMAKDVRTLAIRIADRKDNLDTSFALEKDKRIDAANRALYLYAPLSKIIGFSILSNQLEDVAFKIINPSEYYRIEKDLSANFEEYNHTLSDMKNVIHNILREKNINGSITYRIKSKYGIYKKMQRGLVMDKLGMRILVDSVDECYIVESILKDLLDCYERYRDDYISRPRPSGYKSIHNLFRIDAKTDIEIQIRTRDMHEFNEFGPASHLMYKIGDKGVSSLAYNKFKKYTEENKFWFKNLSFWEIRKSTEDPIKSVPFSKNIYAFTPKGDIIELPKGSCLIDFAYSLHSDLGDKCVGGHANKKYVSLNYEIQNGDYIEIKITNKINANRDWLKFVKTKKAKDHIKRLLKDGK